MSIGSYVSELAVLAKWRRGLTSRCSRSRSLAAADHRRSAVEMAIEKDEKTAMRWLKEQDPAPIYYTVVIIEVIESCTNELLNKKRCGIE